MYTGFCIDSILWKQKEENIEFPENTVNTEPSIHVRLCFLLSVSREYCQYRTQYTCTSMFTSFCFREYWEYRTQYTCTSMFSSFLYMYTGFCILSFLWNRKKKTDVHVYWVLYSKYSLEAERRKHRCTCILCSAFAVLLETERRKHRCTCILRSVFSVFSGSRKKKT